MSTLSRLGRDIPHPIPGTRELPADVIPGWEPPCEDFCESRESCVSCGVKVCPEHEPDACVQCADGGWHHSDECVRACYECALQARDDAMAERADEAWKARAR